jgi:flagellar protein FlbT
MALKVELKPHERIVIGNAVIRNGDTRSRLFIEGDTAIMREKDILTAEAANTPAKRIYFALQLMYLDKNIHWHRNDFITLINEFMTAVPSAWPLISKITDHVLAGEFYKAVKSTRDLIDYETELLSHELRPSRLSEDSTNRNESAPA